MALAMIDVLRRSGMDARIVYASASHAYPFFRSPADSLYDPRIATVFQKSSIRKGLTAIAGKFGGPAINEPLQLRPDDVVVIPEFCFYDFARLYPDQLKVCLVQGVEPMVISHHRRGDTRDVEPDVFVSTSKFCAEAVRQFTGQEPREVRLWVGGAEQRFERSKKRKIAYMPRKLPQQSGAVIRALKASPEAQGYEFVPLHGISHDEVIEELRESLFFLTFATFEGFGLPPAEAMLSGCVVIGYTGIGGQEFFTSDTGFPVQENDVVEFVRTARRVLAAYDDDPADIDALRERASHHIANHYSREEFEISTLQAFLKLDNRQPPP